MVNWNSWPQADGFYLPSPFPGVPGAGTVRLYRYSSLVGQPTVGFFGDCWRKRTLVDTPAKKSVPSLR